MSLFINKLQNAHINTTTNTSYLISSTYQTDNSLVNKGKTEFENDVVVDTRMGIGKATSTSYALDVSGNINLSGSLYKSGVLYDASYGKLDVSNTWIQTNIFNSVVKFNDFQPYSVLTITDTNANQGIPTTTTSLPSPLYGMIAIDMSSYVGSTTSRTITINLPQITAGMVGATVSVVKYFTGTTNNPGQTPNNILSTQYSFPDRILTGGTTSTSASICGTSVASVSSTFRVAAIGLWVIGDRL